jgi:8-oxo-dGTP diphosphatase
MVNKTEGLKKVATLCVLRCDNQFLLLKRFKEPNKNQFTPVGGKIEPYESPLQGVIRETWEETGIAVSKVRFAGILTETSPTKYNWISYVYVADIPFQNPPVCSEGILEWVSFPNLSSIPTPPTDFFLYEYIANGIPFAMSGIYNEQLELTSLSEEISGKQLV